MKVTNFKSLFGLASAKSYKIGVVDDNWLVGCFLRNGSKDFSDFLHEVKGL